MTTFLKDPDAVLDYSVDWSKWLAGDQIETSTWFVSDPALQSAVYVRRTHVSPSGPICRGGLGGLGGPLGEPVVG